MGGKGKLSQVVGCGGGAGAEEPWAAGAAGAAGAMRLFAKRPSRSTEAQRSQRPSDRLFGQVQRHLKQAAALGRLSPTSALAAQLDLTLGLAPAPSPASPLRHMLDARSRGSPGSSSFRKR